MNKYLALVVFIVSFMVYLLTASPAINAGDSGELVAAAFVLGIPHPPGYPLYSMLAKTATFMPLGDVASRINLMSAVLCSMLAALIFRASVYIAGPRSAIPSAAVSLAFAFTGIAWSQALYAEVYPLQVFLSLSSAFFALRAVKDHDERHMYLSCLLAGLSIAGHYGGVIFVPAVLFCLLYAMPGKWGIKRASVCAGMFALGLTPFLYLYVRANAHPPVSWGDSSTPSRFIAHLARSSYGDLSAIEHDIFSAKTAVIAAALVGLIAILIGISKRKKIPANTALAIAAACLTLLMSIFLAVKGYEQEKAVYLLHLLVRERAWLFLPLAAFGLWDVFRRDKGQFYYLALLLFSVSCVSFYRIPAPGVYNFQPLIDKFFLPALAVISLFAALGASWLSVRLAGKYARLNWAWMLFPMLFVVLNYATCDASRDFAARDYATAIMRTIGPDGILLAEGDNEAFLSSYMQNVESARPDAHIFCPKNTALPSWDGAGEYMADKTRPVYYTRDEVDGNALEPAGVLNMAPSAFSRPSDAWRFYIFRVDDTKIRDMDFHSRQLAAVYYFSWARDLRAKGRPREEIFAMLDRAAAAGDELVWANAGIGRIYLGYGELERARALFERGLAVTRKNPDLYLAYAEYYEKAGMPRDAEGSLTAAISLDGGYAQAWMRLARLREAMGNKAGAAEAWRGYLASGEGVDAPFGRANLERLSSGGGDAAKPASGGP
jgi:tetratricopeptide (TPR) repeat protein